jgi:predicted 3-demethylubiquinone-9 3-methyltransferase (glyoxalase superfamily)/uncharacterized protein YndB with AHSA1/START domain
METNIQQQTNPEGDMSVRKVQKICPFLWFDNQAGEAMNFYTGIFHNSEIIFTQPGPDGKVFTGSFRLNGYEFMALNAGPMFSFSPAVSFFATCETEQETDRLWQLLSPGGRVLMELGKYPFSEKYGWLEDKFGISWQIMLLPGVSQTISPSLLFVGSQHAKAEEAVYFYTSLFPDSAVKEVERYTEDDQDKTGTIKYSSFTLQGQNFIAMDSGLDHNFNFTPAISFFVKCDTQEEIDEYWEKLSAGGQKQRCGWLQDQFGVSWQIIPPVLGEMLADPDREKSKRVMDAMLQMDKIIIKDLESAYSGVGPATENRTNSQVLNISRQFNLPVDKVWQAWTDPETFKKWCGPKDFICPHSSIDLKVGGKYLNCMQSAQGEKFWSTGVYREIVPNRKLVCTDSFSDEHGNVKSASDLNMPGDWPLELLVDLTFEEKDGKTMMHLRHEGLPTEMLEECKNGWQQSFDKLENNVI